MLIICLISFVGCDEKNEDNKKQTTQKNTNSTLAQTTIINVTDVNGIAVTNANGQAVTEVVKIKDGTTKKVETTKATTSTATTTAPQTPKSKIATTAKAPVTTARPTTAPQPTQPPKTTAPTTTKASNPYGYVNAWGTIAQMENDCKAYAESMGMIYRTDYNLETGHWITPKASYGFSSPEGFKNRLCGSDTVTTPQSMGYTNIRYLFVTMDNYQDGRCGKYTDNAEMYLDGNKDLVLVYIIIT